MPRHGETIEPKERFVTYAHTLDISDQVLRDTDIRALNRRFAAEAEARARDAAAKIDPDCPVIITVGGIRTLPKPSPFVTRWGVHVRVEFPRYWYDATKKMAEEWEKEQIRRLRYRSTLAT